MILGDAGCAVLRAAAGFWAAASAAATAGRIDGMSSGCKLGLGGWGGPAVTWRPGGPIWSAAVEEAGAGLPSLPSGLGWVGVLQCVRLFGFASAGRNSLHGLHSGDGGAGPVFLGAGWGCPGAWGSMRVVCANRRVWGVVKGVRRVGPWRACAVVWAGGGCPCRRARGCARWWACVGRRVGRGGGGAGLGISRGGVLCRFLCPPAAMRLCGLL